MFRKRRTIRGKTPVRLLFVAIEIQARLHRNLEGVAAQNQSLG